MKTKLTILIFLACFFSSVQAQINMADSTVQTLTYWDLNESHVYEIVQSSMSMEEGKDAKNDTISMKVKITVIDSTATSYTVQWEFLDYNLRESAFSPKLESLLKARKIIYRTNELGVFEELLNWEEVRDNLIARTKETIALIEGESESEEFKENLNNAMSSTLEAISSKEYITNKEIEHVQLFHTFMGSVFKLGEVIESKTQTPNNYFPDKPLNAKITLELYEINEEHNFSVIRYQQTVDNEQLTTMVKDYFALMAENMGKEIDLSEIVADKQLEHKSVVASAIDNWGWPLYIQSITSVNFGTTEKTINTTIKLID